MLRFQQLIHVAPDFAVTLLNKPTFSGAIRVTPIIMK